MNHTKEPWKVNLAIGPRDNAVVYVGQQAVALCERCTAIALAAEDKPEKKND